MLVDKMPIRYTVDAPQRVVFTVFEARVQLQQILDFMRNLSADPEFQPDFNQLAEIGAGSLSGINFAALQQISDADPFSATARRAIVAPADVDFGMARMYESTKERGGFAVFRTMGEARKWLGVG